MTEIRAFVGHSFSLEDDGVVAVFLNYFDELQSSLPSFSWVHAQTAEPRELAQKVLALIADRNVFIGICTRKERVALPEKLRVPLLAPKALQGQAEDFAWKTSDWVLQEIGLAVGRQMSLVLLLENGCRKPGGIQGDLEFIPFDRNAPEKAFVKLLQMIGSLSPSPRQTGSAVAEGPQEPSSPVPDVPGEEGATEIPDTSWDRDKYDQEFLWALLRNKGAEVEIDRAYLETAEARDGEKQAEWQAITEAWRILTGRGGALDRIKALSVQFPDNAGIRTRLASSMNALGSHTEAAENYLLAAGAWLSDPPEAERLRGLAALQFVRADRRDLAVTILNAQRQWLQEYPDQERAFLETLREFSTITKDDDLSIEVMERLIELKPDDFENRFSLAYKHSEMGREDLALHHYLQIPRNQRTPITWNNIGVSFQHFQLYAKAVSAYRASSVSDETLAMSNLGYKFMNAGFLIEAEAEFNKAIKIENFHRNVGEGIAALRDFPEKEEEREQKMLEQAKPKIEFFRRLGGAVVRPPVAALQATWHGPDCDLTVVVEGENFRALGSYDRPATAFDAFGAVARTTRYSVEYVGKIVGGRVDGSVQRTSEGDAPPSLISLGMQQASIQFAMIVESTGMVISVVENSSSPFPQFYDLRRA